MGVMEVGLIALPIGIKKVGQTYHHEGQPRRMRILPHPRKETTTKVATNIVSYLHNSVKYTFQISCDSFQNRLYSAFYALAMWVLTLFATSATERFSRPITCLCRGE